jgi:hypothetical protein
VTFDDLLLFYLDPQFDGERYCAGQRVGAGCNADKMCSSARSWMPARPAPMGIVSSQLGGSGRIYKMTGRANQRLSGADSSVHARLRKGSDRYTGSVHLTKNRTRGATVFPVLDVRYSNYMVTDVKLEVQVRRVTKAATVIYKLFGQAQA